MSTELLRLSVCIMRKTKEDDYVQKICRYSVPTLENAFILHFLDLTLVFINDYIVFHTFIHMIFFHFRSLLFPATSGKLCLIRILGF